MLPDPNLLRSRKTACHLVLPHDQDRGKGVEPELVIGLAKTTDMITLWKLFLLAGEDVLRGAGQLRNFYRAMAFDLCHGCWWPGLSWGVLEVEAASA